jgi:hypothetical protein
VKNAPDFRDLNCHGVFVHNNSFAGNAGCNHAFGNVIVSCEPNHPNVVHAAAGSGDASEINPP